MISVSAPVVKATLALAFVAVVAVGLVRYGRGRRPTRFLGGIVVIALAGVAGRTASGAVLPAQVRTTALVFAGLLLLVGVGFTVDAVRPDRARF